MSRLLDRVLDPARAERIAIEGDDATAPITYRALAEGARALGRRLGGGPGGLRGAPVAFLFLPGAAYVEALLGVMSAGGLAVPLSPLHTRPELQQLLDDTCPIRVLCAPGLRDRLPPELPCPLELDPAVAPGSADPPVADDADGLMLFTSGTTGRPKGVVSSHGALAACVESLHQAWGWRPDDRLLHVLPLHHTHGVMVALLGALWAGASVRFGDARPEAIWRAFASASVFMGVPSIHARLLEAFTAAGADDQARFRQAAAGLRLCTSGSAALPPSLLEGFAQATGQRLLERYGMTEIGMALSNPLDGPRVAGTVGRELPGVTVDIVDEQDRPCAGRPAGRAAGALAADVHPLPSGSAGHRRRVRRRGPLPHRRHRAARGHRLGAPAGPHLGRRPEERRLQAVGAGDRGGLARSPGGRGRAWRCSATPTRSRRVGHGVGGAPPGPAPPLSDLQTFARERLAPYKLPRALHVLAELPRNAMGKVQKPA